MQDTQKKDGYEGQNVPKMLSFWNKWKNFKKFWNSYWQNLALMVEYFLHWGVQTTGEVSKWS